jgi:hypothetical protein
VSCVLGYVCAGARAHMDDLLFGSAQHLPGREITAF